MKKSQQLVVLIILVGFVAGSISSFVIFTIMNANEKETQEELIADFYATETAVLVSPHGLRKSMLKGDDSFVLVDVRSEEEYIEEHIVGAVNIPAYKDRDHSDYGAVERITNGFKKISEENPDKDIIVYCYSIPCMTGRKVGDMLAENGIYVKELGIGWNEWRYFWTLWNHPHEWEKTNVEDYVTSGEAPGELDPRLISDEAASGVCPIEGSLGC